MKSVIPCLLALVFLGSPVWTSAIVASLPPRRLAWTGAVCAIQLVLAYALWWFFRGGGIGGEAHLPEWWQAGLLLAFLPLGVTFFRFRNRQPPRREDQP